MIVTSCELMERYFVVKAESSGPNSLKTISFLISIFFDFIRQPQ